VSGGLVLAIGVALAFALTNGLLDAANSIAALVATRAARPKTAILLASTATILGPLVLGTAVADTISSIVDLGPASTIAVVGAGLTGAVIWNIGTWRLGIPSSAGHALIGGLVGAAVLDGGWGAINWGGHDGLRPVGLLGALLALAIAPVLGLAAGFVAEHALRRATRRGTSRLRGPVRGGEWAMSGLLAFGQGANDASKTIGLIALVLFADGRITSHDAPLWVKVLSSVVFTFGTTFGGWPVVRTLGRRIFRLRPLDGLASQSSGAAVIIASTLVGAPVATTHVVASSLVGTGIGRGRWRHVGWRVVRDMLGAWVLTMPGCAILAALALVPWRWVT
jgi:inorganic phosphate transporter, PiT family